MALDISKLRQQEQVQTTGTTPAASTSASSSNQPIDMTTGTVSPEEQQAKVLEFIKSGEFKKCPNDQKLALLKQQFPHLNSLSKEEFGKYLTEVVTLARQAEQGDSYEQQEVTNTPQETDITTSNITEEDVANTSELEQLASAYANENKIQADIDEIIAHIQTKHMSGEALTETEQKILNIYQPNTVTQTAESNTKTPIFTEEQQEKIMQEKDLEKRFSKSVELYLENYDKEYNAIENKKDKENYLESKIRILMEYCSFNEHTESISNYIETYNLKCNKNDLEAVVKHIQKRQKNGETLSEEDNKLIEGYNKLVKDFGKNGVEKQLDKFDKDVFTTNCLAALQILHDNNMTIEELLNIERSDFDTQKHQNEIKAILTTYEQIKNDRNIQTKDKVRTLLEKIFEKQDQEYINSPNKEQYITDFINKMIEKEYGESIDNISPADKRDAYVRIKLSLDYALDDAKNNPDKPIEIKTLTRVEQYTLINQNLNQELQTARINGSDPENIQKINNYIETYAGYLKIEQLREQYKDDPIGFHKALEKELPNLTGNARERADKILATAQLQSGCNEHIDENHILTNSEFFGENDLATTLSQNYDNLNPENFEEYKENFLDIAIRAYNNTETKEQELEQLRTFLLEKGISEYEIDRLFNDAEIHLCEFVECACENLGEEYANRLAELDADIAAAEQAGDIEQANKLRELKTNVIRQSSHRHVLGDAPQELTEVGAQVQHNREDSDIFNSGLHENQKPETIKELYEQFSKSDKFTNSGLSNITESLIETAPDDKSKVDYAEALSNMGNAAMLEGVAAGADSVQNQNYRNQYNSVVTEAVQNYPPEVQQNIYSALTSGQITQSTMNSTEPATNSYYPEADTYSTNTDTTNTTTSTSNDIEGNSIYNNNPQQPTNSTGTQFVNVDYQTPATQATRTQTPETSKVSISDGNTPTKTTTTPTQTTVQHSSGTSETIREQALQNQVEASQKIKDLALENVAEVKAQIDESIAEWELKQELKLSDEVVSELKEIAASEALKEYIEANPTKKQEVLNKLANADSISEVYDILLNALGSKVHTKFIDNLARFGSIGNVKAFLESKAGNTDVIKQILLRTTSTTLKNELIGMLPESDILELLDKNLLTTLDNVDHDIIFTYVSKNIYSMTQTNFANFLKYLPFDEREKLIAMRNQSLGVTPEEDKVNIEPLQEEHIEVQTNPIIQGQHQTGITQGVNSTQILDHTQNPAQPQTSHPTQTPQQPQKKTNQKDNTDSVDNPQTKFKAGETTKVLNDGRVITSQGTTFAGVSNNVEEGFRIVDPKPKKDKTGAPIGMNDEVLVPGSPEWLRKYNRQAPTTAFTMAALEQQAEDDGLNFGSNRVKIGQPIKKKYNPNSFNIRG